jgi:integrase
MGSPHLHLIHAVLRAALNTALRDQLVIRNIAALVKPPQVVDKEAQPLTVVEARRFLESLKGDRLEALFTVAMSLGLRQGEALGLRWGDVDFEAGTLHIRYALQRLAVADDAKPAKAAGRRTYTLHLVEPKTRQSRGTIALPKATLSSPAAHKARQTSERRLAGSQWRKPVLMCEDKQVPTSDLVFVTMLGAPCDARATTRRFQTLLKMAGVGHHRYHDLRHTAATLLSIQGVHSRAIQSALGWESPAMLSRYSHFVEEQRAAVADAMDGILKPVAVKTELLAEKAKSN